MLDHKRTCVLGLLAAFAAWAAPSRAADLTVDRATTYQTIEGFGFFGAADVWWSSASTVLDQAWTDKVIDDLGITMWRNEYYAAGTTQDATWDKQRPVVQALVQAASQRGVKLKIILTVWSPPATMKCLSGDGTTCARSPPTRPADTKGGNILDPAMRADLATWLIAGAQMYHDAGADLYALSFQNEPLFKEDYNSCVYQQDAYAKTLAAIGPAIKAAFPGLKLFGSENMLGTECGKSPGTAFDPYWYTANIVNVPAALSSIDAFAVHGYVDGVSATATSKLAAMWASFRTATATTGKSVWMTETSGYTHTWPGTSSAPGPLDLGQAIYASLAYGNLSAWTYWQGSEKGGYSDYSLMAGATSLGKNYQVSKQFFRYIRPGAQRVDVKSGDPEVMAVAFQNTAMNAFTIVAINTGSASKSINLVGAGLPADFHAFRTSASENAADLGTVAAASLTLPASSITSFVNGSYREDAGGAGAGGSSGHGGATGTGGKGGSAGSGSVVATGGGTGSGGASPSGGVATTGSVVGTGGVRSGGTIGSGGAMSGSGGAAGTGVTGAGGVAGVGGTTGAGGTSVTKGGSSGCGCKVAGPTGRMPALWAIVLAGIAVIATRARRRTGLLAGLLASAVFGCGESSTTRQASGGTQESGGKTSTGGVQGSGGTQGTAGAAGNGGTQGSGGQAAGGGAGTGGVTSTGGLPGTGGKLGTGGTQAAGGTTSAGGRTGSGGASSTGGATGTGGTGGTMVTGGQTGTGGALAAGGAAGTGGRTGTGGAAGTGGATATGGKQGTGGATGTGGGTGTCGSASLGYDQAILCENPVAYLAMNKITGSEPDLTGNNHTGTYQGGNATSTTAPNGDTAADFNGASQYLTIPSSAAFSIPTTGNLTWEAWIKPDVLQFPNDSDGYVDWMGKCADYSPTCEWEARMYSTTNSESRCNRISAYVFNSSAGLGSAADWQPTCGLIQAGKWYHVVGEYTTKSAPSDCANTSSYPGSIEIWVNGVQWNHASHGDTGCMSQYNVVPKANTSPVNIGTMAGDAWFPGSVAKVAIYDRLLTATQITNHYKLMTGNTPTGTCANTCSF